MIYLRDPMAFHAYRRYPAQTGSQTDYPIDFPYLSRNDIEVKVNGAYVSFEFLDSNRVRLLTAPTGNLEIYRSTDITEAAVTFLDGAVESAGTHNVATLQTLYALQEHYDRVALGLVDLNDITPTPTTPIEVGDFIWSDDYVPAGQNTADCTAGLQAFIDACSVPGAPQGRIRPGRYPFTALTVTGQVNIEGFSGRETYETTKGVWLHHTSTTQNGITFDGDQARGSRFAGINFSQSHPSCSPTAPAGSWSPTTHEPLIRVKDCYGGVTLENLFLYGIYRGIYATNSGRMRVFNILGQVFNTFYEADQQFDSDRVIGVHLWPHWNSALAVKDYQQRNCAYFQFGRCDTPFLDQIFLYAGRYAIQFTGNRPGQPVAGTTTRARIGHIQADAVPGGIFCSGGSFNVEATFDQLDIQGEWFARPSGGAVLGVPGVWPIHVTDGEADLQINHLRVEFVDQGILTEDSAVGASRVRINTLRASFYNTSGTAPALFNARATTSGASEVTIGTEMFLEIGNGLSNETAGNIVLKKPGTGGGTGGPVTDTIRSLDGLTAVSAQNAVGARLDNNGVSIWTGDGNIKGSIWSLTGSDNLKEYIDKKTTGGTGGSSSKLLSPSGNQEAEIKDSGGFFVTDTVNNLASRLVADGNIDAGPGGQWSLSGTTDLKNYLDKKFAEGGSGGASNVIRSPDTLTALETVNSVGARLDNNGTSIWTGDGNQTGAGFSAYGGSNLFAVLGAYDTRLDALEASSGGGGGVQSVIRSPDTLSALTMVNATGARLDNNGTSVWTGDGNLTGNGFSTYGSTNLFGVLGVYDGRLDALEASSGGGGGSSLTNGSATATLSNVGALQVSYNSISASFQNDGNIVGARVFNNATNGGLGGNGTLTNYIDARAQAYVSPVQSTANSALSTAQSAQSTANSASSAASSASAGASSALSALGSWNASGSSWTYGGTQVLQSDGNVFGSSVFGFLGGSTNLFNALQNLNGRISSDHRLKVGVQRRFVDVDDLMGLGTYNFEFDREAAPWAPEGTRFGLIAQEVLEVLPEAVVTTNDDYLGLDPLALCAVLIASVQQLNAELKELKASVSKA